MSETWIRIPGNLLAWWHLEGDGPVDDYARGRIPTACGTFFSGELDLDRAAAPPLNMRDPSCQGILAARVGLGAPDMPGGAKA